MLQEVFETTFSFDLEPLQKKGLKLAAKQLSRFQAASDFAVGWVSQHALGGHAVPVDAQSLRVLRRTGLMDQDEPYSESSQAALDELVPKARVGLFSDVISGVADEFCFEHKPDCPHCPLKPDCATAQNADRHPTGTSKTAAHKPR
jgi:endonuclease-3